MPGLLPPVGNPLDPSSLEPYKFEVFQQCFAATDSWNRAERLLSNIPKDTPEGPMVAALRIVSDIQGFAVAVGILSDLFFPTSKGDANRGQRLRSLYSVSAGSALSGAKVLVRHALVHLDERLDRWLPGQAGKVVGPVAIEPWDGPAPPMEHATAARIIDNKNWRLLVFGDELDLRPLLLEIGRISVLFPLEFDGPNGKIRITLSSPGPAPST